MICLSCLGVVLVQIAHLDRRLVLQGATETLSSSNSSFRAICGVVI